MSYATRVERCRLAILAMRRRAPSRYFAVNSSTVCSENARRAITITSHPAGNASGWVRKIWRKTRFARLRTTARLPTNFLEATIPKRTYAREGVPEDGEGGAAFNTKDPQSNREPSALKRVKSDWFRSLCEAGKRMRSRHLVGEAFASLSATIVDDRATAAGTHACTETALTRAAKFRRTIGRLHNKCLLNLKLKC